MVAQKLYKIKWVNYDLPEYIKGLRLISKSKRDDAGILMKQADAIDGIIDKLATEIVEHVPDEEPA